MGIRVPDYPDIRNDTNDGTTQVFVAVNLTLVGILQITDTIRPESRSVISNLKEMGISRIEILTGDSQTVAARIGDACGIPSDAVHSGMYPIDKEKYIADLQQNGDVVCFVGDGTNDGPALALFRSRGEYRKPRRYDCSGDFRSYSNAGRSLITP